MKPPEKLLPTTPQKPPKPKRPMSPDQLYAFVRRETQAIRGDLRRSGIMG